ncbi:hypothetical protein, partial [Thiolapillus sp.]|uniref:hypothetical protein n=3 Tax=Thiolapillus sp. TaxID=2017437 RepID=UPI003AF602BA
ESPIPVAVSRCRPRLFLMPVFGAILAQVFGGIPLKTSRNLFVVIITSALFQEATIYIFQAEIIMMRSFLIMLATLMTHCQ